MNEKWTLRSADQAAGDRTDAAWGSLTWLASQPLTGCEGVMLGRVVIKAGQSNPAHLHGNCEEVLYLMAGRLEHWMGDEKVIMEPGDTLAVAAGVDHYARSIGDEDADMIVAYSIGEREFTKKD